MKTIRIRIAVAVSQDSKWNSCGWWESAGDAESASMALEGLDRGGVVHFVEAEVPVPETQTLVGEVFPCA